MNPRVAGKLRAGIVAKQRDDLRALVLEITEHYDPMFGILNLHRLDDRAWMNKAAKVLGEDLVFPWKKNERKKNL